MTRRLLACAAIFLAISGALVTWAPSASACGYWVLEDVRGTRRALFFVNAVLDESAQGRERVLAVLGKSPEELRATTRDGAAWRIDRGRLLRAGRTVGTLEHGMLEVGRRHYRISVTARAAPPAHLAWRVRVERDGREVARGKALSFCQCHSCPPEERRRDVERRIALYLAARVP